MLLKIAHLDVPVIEKPLGPDLMGEYDNGTATIFINDDLTTQLHKTTLFHESLHAISCIYGLELSENQVLILESAVLALIRDNPNIFN